MTDTRKIAFETLDGKAYYADAIKKLLKSRESEDKQKLDQIIIDAVDEDNSRALRYLLRNGYKIGEIRGSGKTFLHWAFYGDPHDNEAIISYGIKFWLPYITKEVVNIVDSNGLSFLHVACRSAKGENLIKKCFEHRVNVNAHFRSDPKKMQRDGFTPLHFATINPKGLNYLKLLIDHGADVNARDSRDRTPLHVACRTFENPDKEISEVFVKAAYFFLDNNADIDAKDYLGNTPLLSLFPESYTEFRAKGYRIRDVPVKETILKLKLFLERGADVTASNRDGDTILHLIVKNLGYGRLAYDKYIKRYYKLRNSDHAEMIRLILKYRPNVNVNVKNILGETALQLAIFHLSADIVEILLKHNADNLGGKLDFQDGKYFECLVSYRDTTTVPQLGDIANFLNILEMLLSNDYQIDSEQNLDILAYLTHEYHCCDCSEFYMEDEYSITCHGETVLNFGSSSHFESVYDKIMVGLFGYSHFQEMYFRMLMFSLRLRKYANFYIDPTLPSKFITSKVLNDPILQYAMEMKSELQRTKSTKLKNNVTLYNVMTKHPHKIYQFLTDVDLSSVMQGYFVYNEIIAGHLTKSLVRHYVEQSTIGSVKDLFSLCLPLLCCKMIMDYLTNKDILNVCRAVNGK